MKIRKAHIFIFVLIRSVNRGGAWGVSPPLLPKINREKGVYAPLLLKISFFLLIKIEK
jgi:hypothetical protein